MTVITLEQVRAWRPCPDYTDERLAELAAGRESITVAEALDLPIPAKDRVWLLTRPGVLPDEVLWAWADACEHRTVGDVEYGDIQSPGEVLDELAAKEGDAAYQCTESFVAEMAAMAAERERQIADLRAILAAQGKETDRDSDHS